MNDTPPLSSSPSPADPVSSDVIDTSVPHSARIWNYWLGGADNYLVDRQAGDAYRQTFPAIVDYARSSRMFLTRAVRYLAHDAGIRQFLDVGAGLPTADNTHEVAQQVAPESRIVYVDHDPMVVALARARLTSGPEGAIDYIEADLHDVDALLRSAARTLDFTQPVALMLMGVLGHITDDDEVLSMVRRLLDELPSGSYLVRYDGTSTDETFEAAQDDYDDTGAVPYRLRKPDQIAESFAGLELVEPGIVSCPQWRPDATDAEPGHVDSYCGVGRKP